MSLNVSSLRNNFPDLLPEPLSRARGATAYRLKLPQFPWGRDFAWAELVLPHGFPDRAVAKIMLSPDAVLRVLSLNDVDQLRALTGRQYYNLVAIIFDRDRVWVQGSRRVRCHSDGTVRGACAILSCWYVNISKSISVLC